jgi:hypothetical protein
MRKRARYSSGVAKPKPLPVMLRDTWTRVLQFCDARSHVAAASTCRLVADAARELYVKRFHQFVAEGKIDPKLAATPAARSPNALPHAVMRVVFQPRATRAALRSEVRFAQSLRRKAEADAARREVTNDVKTVLEYSDCMSGPEHIVPDVAWGSSVKAVLPDGCDVRLDGGVLLSAGANHGRDEDCVVVLGTPTSAHCGQMYWTVHAVWSSADQTLRFTEEAGEFTRRALRAFTQSRPTPPLPPPPPR